MPNFYKLLFPEMLCCSPTDWADIYYTVYNFELYVFPLAIIVATHLKIYLLLKRYVSLTVSTINSQSFLQKTQSFLSYDLEVIHLSFG